MVPYLFIFYLLIIVNERNLAEDIDIYSTNVTLKWEHFSIFKCENNSIDISLFECICSTEYQEDFENRCVKEQTDTYDSEACFATTTSTTSSSTSSTTTTSTTSSSTSSTTTNKPIVTDPPTYQCKDPNYIGDHCNILHEIHEACKQLKLCSLPHETCHPNKTLELGYTCQCSDGHSGVDCKSDNIICKSNTCWHNGECILINETILFDNETILFDNETTFDCLCEPGYDGDHCELMIDMCTNITCQNKGRCISSYPTWRCQCINEAYYYGEYCENKHGSLIVRQALSKSFASIAITAIVTLFLFVITMDILKYGFKIDPVDRERRLMKLEQEKNQYKKKKKKKEPKKIALRFLYVP